tara:strand:+ start:217 stop:1158 length:942 start_codon:yes stop_codon:yes gene_type:complete
MVVFLPIYLFAQDTSFVYDQKLNQLRTYLGIIENAELDIKVYSALINKLDSLGINDEQLKDGYEWGGGKIGFEAYIKNNIDRLLSDFSLRSLRPDSLIIKTDFDSLAIPLLVDSVKNLPKPIIIEESLEPVEDLYLKVEQTVKTEKKTIRTNSKDTMFSRYRIGYSFGKVLISGAAFSDYTSFFEPKLSVRTPLKIRTGSIYISLGYESSNYNFEAPSDTISSYSGTYSGPILFFDISEIIKIGEEKFGKYLMGGIAKYDHGSGFVGGFDLTMFLGSFPLSFSIENRVNVVALDSGATTYWFSASAGLGIDIR